MRMFVQLEIRLFHRSTAKDQNKNVHFTMTMKRVKVTFETGWKVEGVIGWMAKRWRSLRLSFTEQITCNLRSSSWLDFVLKMWCRRFRRTFQFHPFFRCNGKTWSEFVQQQTTFRFIFKSEIVFWAAYRQVLLVLQ